MYFLKILNMKKQIFFSHDWRIDSEGRNNHKRVYNIVKQIQKSGYTTWFDEEDMAGNIDAAMADGIENADAVVICITETYCNKVNNASRDLRVRDNCLKEWTYANARNKLMIPIIMEPKMLNTYKWPPGVVSMYLASTLYINATKDDDKIAIFGLIKILEINGINRKILPPIKNEKSINIETNDYINNIVYKKHENNENTVSNKNLSSLRQLSPTKLLFTKKPLSPIKSSSLNNYLNDNISPKKLIRSKTTNFTFTRMSPIFFPQSFSENKTKVRAKSEVIKSHRFNLNYSLFSHCMPKRIAV